MRKPPDLLALALLLAAGLPHTAIAEPDNPLSIEEGALPVVEPSTCGGCRFPSSAPPPSGLIW